MSENIKKETCQVAVPLEIMDRVRYIKDELKNRHKRIKIQDMVSEALVAYCDDMEKELNKHE